MQLSAALQRQVVTLNMFALSLIKLKLRITTLKMTSLTLMHGDSFMHHLNRLTLVLFM